MSIESTSDSKPSAKLQRALPTTLRNVFSNWGGFVFSAVVNFLLAPFVLRHLGSSLYGISVLIMSITGYLGLLDLGVRGAMTRYMAKFHALSEHQEASRFTSAALYVFGAGGILAIILSLVLAAFAGSFPVPGMSSGWTQVLIVLGGINVAASLLSGVFSGIPMALQRFDQVNAISISSTLLRALLIVLVLSEGGGLIALVCVQLVYTVAATVASAWVTLRLYEQLRIRFEFFTGPHVSLILSFSVYSFSLLVFDTGIMYLNSVVLGTFQSAQLVTYFWIAASLINYSRSLVSGISKTSTPVASALDARGDTAGLRRTLLSGASYATLVVLPIAVTFAMRGRSFIGLWMGWDYAELSGRVLWILTLGLAFSASSQVALAIMLGISKHRAVAPAFLIQALCILLASLATVRRYGVVGVAWSTTIPYLAVSLFFWPLYLRKTLQIQLPESIYSIWVKPALACLPFGLCTLALERFCSAPNLAVFFLQTGALSPIALAGFWYVYFTREHRREFARTYLQSAWDAIRFRS
jgi:O-antigen/teichoic acid export membrane protein